MTMKLNRAIRFKSDFPAHYYDGEESFKESWGEKITHFSTLTIIINASRSANQHDFCFLH